MNERTRAFLAAARRHHAAAEFLQGVTDEEPSLREWIAVMAFYAAVHYINGYLWEQRQIEPANHAERSQFVSLVRDLRSVRDAYRNLRDAAYLCRYDPLHRESTANLQSHLNDLRAIQRTVVTLLGQS